MAVELMIWSPTGPLVDAAVERKMRRMRSRQFGAHVPAALLGLVDAWMSGAPDRRLATGPVDDWDWHRRRVGVVGDAVLAWFSWDEHAVEEAIELVRLASRLGLTVAYPDGHLMVRPASDKDLDRFVTDMAAQLRITDAYLDELTASHRSRYPGSGTVKYDDRDWYEGAAVEMAGSDERAGVHIALYLGWLVRRDMHEPSAFELRDLDDYAAGRTSATGLLEVSDGKIVSDQMGPEGVAFSDARYGRYVEAYADLVAGQPPFGVTDESSTISAVDDLLDGLYRAWVADGRPGPVPGDAPTPDDGTLGT